MGWCKHIPTRFVVALLLSETAVSLPMIFLCMVMYGNVQEYAIMQFYSMCIINIIYIYVCAFGDIFCQSYLFRTEVLIVTARDDPIHPASSAEALGQIFGSSARVVTDCKVR